MAFEVDRIGLDVVEELAEAFDDPGSVAAWRSAKTGSDGLGIGRARMSSGPCLSGWAAPAG